MKALLTLCLILATTLAQAQSVVSTTTILGQTTITPQDVALSDTVADGALSDLASVIGMEARFNLYPGRPIRPGDLQPPAVIARNDLIILRFEGPGLVIVTEGRALDRAVAGQRFRALNIASRSTVTAVAVGPGVARVGDLP